MSQDANIVFQISAGKNFDGECQYRYSENQKPTVNIVITDKSLTATDDALAVLIGYEVSHTIDINKRPFAYKGNIGWEAPEDFANIMGAQIAQNSGYDPEQFIQAQGTANKKTQRAADIIRKYVPKQESNTLKIEKIRGMISTHTSRTTLPKRTNRPNLLLLRNLNRSK